MYRSKMAKQRGLSVIELLLYMTISSTLIAGIYQTFAAQQKMYLHQNSTAALQQNLRTGMYLMTKDIHAAGYNPSRKQIQGLGFVTTFPAPNNKFIINYETQKDIIAFTSDTDGNGSINPDDMEMIAYRFNATDNTLERFKATNVTAGGTWEAIAENIEVVNFIALASDGSIATAAKDIRAVEIALLVRADKPDPKFVEREVYRNKRGTVLCSTCTGDHYHRRLLTTTVQSRNPL